MEPNKIDKRLGAVFAILSAVFFGTMPLFTKTAYAYGCNAYTVAFGRFLVGAAGSAGIIRMIPNAHFRITRPEFQKLLGLSVFYAATPVLLYASYRSISSGLATTLHFTYPVIVMLVGAVVFHDRLHARQIICLLICLAGITCFCKPGQAESASGMALAVASGSAYAFYILLLGRNGLQRLHVMTITFWISLLSAVEISVFAMSVDRISLDIPWQGWMAICGLGLFATVLALALFQLGVFLCGEVKAALLSTFEPLTGVILGVLVFREALTPRTVAGIMSILLSTLLLVMDRKSDLSRRETADSAAQAADR
ncbi:MAG: DMT family transporter [Clostridia bacterium]|nr:DMT family transporter [Clostridia bacterium]